MSLNLADLLVQESVATVRARIVAGLLADGFPTTSWAPSSSGGVENMRLDMAAGVGNFLPPRIVQWVNGRILPLSTGDYLKALGARFYGLTQRDATFTIENLALYAVGSGGSYTFTPGDLIVRSDGSGNRYISIDGGKFSPTNTGPPTPTFPGNPLMLRFQAENPGSSYADSAGTVKTLVTARAGVRCTNIAPADFTPSTVNGTSTGSMVGRFLTPGLKPAFGSIRVAIKSNGFASGPPLATISYSLDGGNTWSATAPIFPNFIIPPTVPGTGGAVLAFSDTGGNPSFVAGDIYTTFVGDAILQRGADAESEAAFRRRCANRWPSLSDVPVAATIDLWAHEASPEVAKVTVDADPNNSGGALITIASSNGPSSPAAQIAVEDYVNARLLGYKGVPAPGSPTFSGTATSPAESALVISALPFNVTVAGPVRVPKAILATAQVASNNNWNLYLGDLPLGGQPGAIIELAKLAQILADAGAIDIPTTLANLLINGASADCTITTGEVAVPTPGTTLLSSLTWIPA